MPAREVSNRGGNVIGHFPSLKLGRMVDYESLIERDFIYLLEYEQDVTWYTEQPLTIPYRHQDKDLAYTPDFYVVRSGRNVVVECKPEKFADSEENRPKFDAARAWCADNGCAFRVVTDAHLRSGYRLQNVKFLVQFARYRIEQEMQDRIRAFLATTPPPVTVADVMVNAVPERPQSVMIPILYLAFHHDLVIPLDEALISVHSSVRLPLALEEIER